MGITDHPTRITDIWVATADLPLPWRCICVQLLSQTTKEKKMAGSTEALLAQDGALWSRHLSLLELRSWSLHYCDTVGRAGCDLYRPLVCSETPMKEVAKHIVHVLAPSRIKPQPILSISNRSPVGSGYGCAG